MDNEKIKKLLLLTLSTNDNEALSALRMVQARTDFHALVQSLVSVRRPTPRPTRQNYYYASARQGGKSSAAEQAFDEFIRAGQQTERKYPWDE